MSTMEAMSPAEGLRELALPRDQGDYVKAAIERAARRAALTYTRAFDIWYGKARKIEEFECGQIAEAVEQKRREAARNELHELRTRIMRLESLLSQSDPAFHRPSIDAQRRQLRSLDGKDGAGHRTLDRDRRAR